MVFVVVFFSGGGRFCLIGIAIKNLLKPYNKILKISKQKMKRTFCFLRAR